MIGVVLAQVAAALGAAVVVGKMAAHLAGPVAAVIAILLFAIDVETNRWHAFILSDSLFLSLLTLATWLVYRARRLRRGATALAVVVMLLAALVRPEGWFLLPAAVVFWIASATAGATRLIAATALVVLGGVLVFALVPRLSGNLAAVGPAEMLRRGQTIWDFDGWRIEMPSDAVFNDGHASSADAIVYAWRHPPSTVTLMAARVAVHFAHVRPYFSAAHNAFVVVWLAPVYVLAACGILDVAASPAEPVVPCGDCHADRDRRTHPCRLGRALPRARPAVDVSLHRWRSSEPDRSLARRRHAGSRRCVTHSRACLRSSRPFTRQRSWVSSSHCQRLHQQGRIHLDITLQYFATRRAIAAADVVVMCGEALPPTRRILQSIAELQRPFVFELDDNRLEIPSDIPGLDYARDPAQRALIIECLRLADVVRVYSTSLRDLVQPYNANVVVVDGPTGLECHHAEAAAAGPAPGEVGLRHEPAAGSHWSDGDRPVTEGAGPLPATWRSPCGARRWIVSLITLEFGTSAWSGTTIVSYGNSTTSTSTSGWRRFRTTCFIVARATTNFGSTPPAGSPGSTRTCRSTTPVSSTGRQDCWCRTIPPPGLRPWLC